MVFENICNKCAKTIIGQDLRGPFPSQRKECEICNNDDHREFYAIQSINYTEDLVQALRQRISSCDTDKCGKKWDPEEKTYIEVEALNSTLAKELIHVVQSLEKDHPNKFLVGLRDEHFEELNLPDVSCLQCGTEITDWGYKITNPDAE